MLESQKNNPESFGETHLKKENSSSPICFREKLVIPLLPRFREIRRTNRTNPYFESHIKNDVDCLQKAPVCQLRIQQRLLVDGGLRAQSFLNGFHIAPFSTRNRTRAFLDERHTRNHPRDECSTSITIENSECISVHQQHQKIPPFPDEYMV